MRHLCSLLISCFVAQWAAAQVEFVRVWPGYRDAESFASISEFFGGAEASRGRTILRTDPSERGGFYWLVRVRNAGAPFEAVLEIEWIAPGEIDPRRQRFPVTIESGSRVLLAGLTGADWPDAKARPNAWQVRLLDAAEQPVATEESFLWAAPASPVADTP